MTIDCISDLHGFQPKLDGGDLLIVAGDLTARDTRKQNAEFYDWLDDQKYRFKIYIAGNHDGFLCDNIHQGGRLGNIQYLCDSGCEYEGLKIWGSPWTPSFLNWHFMKDRGEPIKKIWDLIPDDIDILITHGPPYGILDKIKMTNKGDNFKHAGCEELRKQVDYRIKPILHVFGHVHEGYGIQTLNKTIYVNASIMNEAYEPVNKFIRVIL